LTSLVSHGHIPIFQASEGSELGHRSIVHLPLRMQVLLLHGGSMQGTWGHLAGQIMYSRNSSTRTPKHSFCGWCFHSLPVQYLTCPIHCGAVLSVLGQYARYDCCPSAPQHHEAPFLDTVACKTVANGPLKLRLRPKIAVFNSTEPDSL